MDKEVTLRYIQDFIKNKDHNPELKHAYFMKLVEEVGELGRIIRKNDFQGKYLRYIETGTIKETLEEELYDVLYYVLALANVYGIDMEECFYLKEEYNRLREDH